MAINGNWYGTDANFTLYKEDYIKLYANTIMDVVTNEDKRRPFIVSFNFIQTVFSEIQKLFIFNILLASWFPQITVDDTNVFTQRFIT